MSEENSQNNEKTNENITEKTNENITEKTSENIKIKKPAFTGSVILTIVAVAVVTFAAGFVVGNGELDDNSDYVTKSDLNEMIGKLETKLDNLQTTPTSATLQPSTPSIIRISLDDDPFKGDPDAPVTIVEFSDFQCPFCSRFFEQTLPLLDENYIKTGKVKLVFRDLPLDNLHPNARPAHIAAECADEQGKFWEYHDVLFENQGEWSRLRIDTLSSQFQEYAATLGLESTSFESCLSSDEIAKEVNDDYLQARSYGATGTPTFFIGNEKDGFVKLVGAQPFVSFQGLIESQLG